mmetsp:Transcript_45526/g.134780  ORF Transcript_45526/g.134780 Transcript_45526/m.134780 type:complete len:343 (+) Transcript_45526:54-1082(+)
MAASGARLLAVLTLCLQPVALAGLSKEGSAEAAWRPGGMSIGDYLWEAALPLANLSLHGRFIQQMADGTLPRSVFDRYLAQDNLYLTKYARAYAVLGARADSLDDMAWLVNKSLASLTEHGEGATRKLDDATFLRDAMPVTVAYTSLIVEAAWSESPANGYAAVLPCQRLYQWLFATLKATRTIAPGNPYKAFIEQYADPSNLATTKELEAQLARHVPEGVTPGLDESMLFNYKAAMRYEAEFFAQGYDALPLAAAAVAEVLAGAEIAEINVAPLGRRLPRLAAADLGSEARALGWTMSRCQGVATVCCAVALGVGLALCGRSLQPLRRSVGGRALGAALVA